MDPTRKDSLKHGLAACALAAGAILLQGAGRTLTAEPPAIAAIEVAPAPDPRRAALVDYLSEKYGREPGLTGTIVDEAFAAGEALSVDPLLLLAVIAVESRFDPAARSGYGARGLMQVVPRFHREKLVEHGGEPALLDPRVNVLVGTEILRDSLRKSGSLQAGLQRYAGWQDDEERRYARKVITEKERLRRIARLAQQDTSDERKPS
jgi:soluble lytic murein transglycosylase-like protein